MKNKSSNKGLITLIIILSILVISLLVYLVYNKTNNSNNNLQGNTITNDNKQLQNSNKSENNSQIKIADVFSKFYGKYEYLYEYDEPESCKDYNNLELNSDGTYTYSYGSNCAGAWNAKGNYAISQNKIYLYNDNCNISLAGDECMYPNCEKIIELNYSETNGEISISAGNISLEKK